MFTKWVEIIPVKNKVAATIEKEFHRKIISKWGTPRILFTDNGKEFLNRIVVKLMQNFGFRHSKAPRYHPESNITERCNRSIKTAIKAYLEKDHREWDENLDDLQFALNTSKHASTGFTPAFFNFGRELEPIQTLNKDLINAEEIGKWVERLNRLKIIKDGVQNNLEVANERQTKYYNLRRRPISYEVGEQILRSEMTL